MSLEKMPEMFIPKIETREKEIVLKELADQAFSSWNEALLSRDAKNVAALYTEDASFLPTLNPEFKKGRAGAEEYFKHFLEKNPEGEVVEEMVQETAVDAEGQPTGFLHSGLYNFEVGESDNRQVVEARFTFLWNKDETGAWKISHHHSSVKPLE
jgi:uncharacterized protein (TIGR02246 family)